MIQVQNLSRQYGKFTAVDAVSFDIAGGEVVGLLGHNGAGKSTIMRMLSGYLEPSSGSIRVDGITLENDPDDMQQSLGYLPENLPVYPEMMVADYLDYAATLKGIERSKRNATVREAIIATDLGARALDTIGTLSRGLKQRVGVAQAILGSPRLLILDEPTNGLDPGQTEGMRQLIRRIANRATVILSTHIMQEVEAVCDRVLVLSNGKLILNGLLADLKASDNMLLRTCDSVAELPGYLSRLPQVSTASKTRCDENHCDYLITLRPGTDHDTAANNICQTVVNAGARLYSLQPVVRDLDTVFRQATDLTDVSEPS